tara:strand:- start:266 stop:2545 length:2280 start_codon:yes stop_codon:yes gene_type:complete
MEQRKLDRIKNLEHEVNDFHPVLNALLRKIPYISNLEYTQGPNEKGADFVLEKIDETLNTTTYIGVIVKIGKIKQDNSEIERQIDECSMERTFENGKKKIFITEIWVVCNETITENGKQKIHHKFKNQNIHFFDGAKIAGLIEKFYPEYWTDISVKLGEYIRKTKQFTEKITKNSALIEFQENINIEQKIIKITNKIKHDQGRKKSLQQTTIHDAIKNEQLIFLQGQMGSGKSNLIKRALDQITDPERINSERLIPIALTFKEFYETHNQKLETIISEAITESSTNNEEYSHIIVIDGLDEIPLTTDEQLSTLKLVSTFVRSRQNTKVIITSRPIDDIKQRSEIDKIFTRFEVCPLSTRQLLSFVEKACDSAASLEKLTAGIERSQLFKTLPKTPISAILLARIMKEDPSELPSTMTELYAKYSELVLGRWDMSKGLQSQKEYEIIDNVCIDLGSYIIKNSLDEISANEAKNFFTNYIKERNLKLSPESAFSKFLSKTEIVNYNKTNHTINFKHRTFAEYFSAKKISRDNGILINSMVFDPYWATTFFFFIGMKRDCPDLIDAIMAVDTENEQQRINRIFHTAQYLLAGYLTPYKNISSALSKTYTLAAELMNEALTGKSPLSALPPMQLTFIMTHAISNCYGYEYFEEAIHSALLEKLEISNPSEIQVLEIFLLSSTSAFLGKNDAFDGLIDEYGKDLPEHLKLGIHHINSDFALKSDTVKRFIKKHLKNIKSRSNTSEYINRLYELPISKQVDPAQS